MTGQKWEGWRFCEIWERSGTRWYRAGGLGVNPDARHLPPSPMARTFLSL